jgi:diguanylate cyclase (GGDEF)-like protein
MELMLWRWSTTVQLSSLAIIAVFFAVLARTVRAAELRWWVLAWCADFFAITVALAYWYLTPPPWTLPIALPLYMGGKTAFVLLLMEGAWSFKRPGRRLFRAAIVVPVLIAYLLGAAMTIGSINQLGVVQHSTMGLLLAGGCAFILRQPREDGLTWLAAGFLLRSLLSFVEAAAYGLQLMPGEPLPEPLRSLTATFLASHSSFDSGTEWLLALGCVLALSERAQRELRQYNRDLLDAQADLRKLVDRDALTGLANRRSLDEIFRVVRPEGATLLFFDLDGFKEVNDLHGHQVGDDCLRRFASALTDCFRPTDVAVRYAGDEFLVVARGLSESQADERVQLVRQRLRNLSGQAPAVTFSVGVAALSPGGDPGAALKVADECMYRAKEERLAFRRSATDVSPAV